MYVSEDSKGLAWQEDFTRNRHSKNMLNKTIAGRLFQDYDNYVLSHSFRLLNVTCLFINMPYIIHLHVNTHTLYAYFMDTYIVVVVYSSRLIHNVHCICTLCTIPKIVCPEGRETDICSE